VIDELLLHLEPLSPTDTANLLICPAAQLILKGLKRHPISLQPASGTMQGCHAGKIDILENVIQSIGRMNQPL
jgi:hypothetical protein